MHNRDYFIVEAWKVSSVDYLNHYEKLPDWIKNSIVGYQITYKDSKTLEVNCSMYGHTSASDGDYIAKDIVGNLWVYKGKPFEENFSTYIGDEKNAKAEFVVESIEEQDDGSAILKVDMSYETLKAFAAIGLRKVLEDAASEVIKENES